MSDKFNFYDFIAVLIPGLFFLISLKILIGFSSIDFYVTSSLELMNSFALIVFGYVFGVLLQGISQGITQKLLSLLWGGLPSEKWLLDSESKLTSDYKNQLWNKINLTFHRDKPIGELLQIKKVNNEIFYLIYRHIEKQKITEKHQIFNAQFSFFRCLLTAFVFLLVVSIYQILCSWSFDFKNLSFLIFSFIGIVVSYSGALRRGEDFVKCILDSFIV